MALMHKQGGNSWFAKLYYTKVSKQSKAKELKMKKKTDKLRSDRRFYFWDWQNLGFLSI